MMIKYQFDRLNERFANLADLISEVMGLWPVSASSFLLILLWSLFCASTQGASWWYSSFYNFPLNLVTTVAELFIGFFLAAAANRVERHNQQLQDNHTQMLSQLGEHDQRMMELLTKIEKQEELLLEIRSSYSPSSSSPPSSLPPKIDSSVVTG